MPTFAGRLPPVVTVPGNRCVLLVPSLMTLPTGDLRHPVGNLAADRDRITAALDYLCIGF